MNWLIGNEILIIFCINVLILWLEWLFFLLFDMVKLCVLWCNFNDLFERLDESFKLKLFVFLYC